MATEAKTFTVAQLARDLKIDAKMARRRIRAAFAKKDTKVPAVVKTPGRKNTRWEFTDTKAHRDAVTAIIKTDAKTK